MLRLRTLVAAPATVAECVVAAYPATPDGIREETGHLPLLARVEPLAILPGDHLSQVGRALGLDRPLALDERIDHLSERHRLSLGDQCRAFPVG